MKLLLKIYQTDTAQKVSEGIHMRLESHFFDTGKRLIVPKNPKGFPLNSQNFLIKISGKSQSAENPL